MSSNNNNSNAPDEAEAARSEVESNKRAALAGQWRTPPMPAFPAVAATAEAAKAAVAMAPPPSIQVSQLPGSAEDYAKALQEAYLRGAEAGAAMAAGMPSAVSCPDFAGGIKSQHPHHHHQQQQQQQQQATVPIHATNSNSAPVYANNTATTATTNTTPFPPVMSTTSAVNQNNMNKNYDDTTAVASPKAPPTMTPSVPNPLPAASATPPPPPPATTTATTTTTTTTTGGYGPSQQQQAHTTTPTTTTTTIPARAMSLPDMTTYAAQQEEEKRQKRLARNRASARLRRLRKKNLVDAYEQEVGILEKTLEQLKAHEWGETDNTGALAEALSMDRGQQVLDLTERQREAADLLRQQLEWLQMLEDIMMEDYVLHQIVAGNPEVRELADSLQLSPEQLRRAEESKSGWQDEWDALQTVKASLVSLQQNEWLWNEGAGGVAEQFMGILHKNQISKFLLWADANAEAIDELDGVHASEGVPSGPVFAFGIESQPEGLNEE